MNLYGVFIIGPSGSGKSTLCSGLSQFFNGLKRPCKIINLDPAVDDNKYVPDIDIQDLIKVDDVMEQFKLGPNGALIFCIDFIAKNIEWLIEKISKLGRNYLIFDLPGQIEIYLNSDSIKQIFQSLIKNDKFQANMCIVELFDSFLCYDTSNFLSCCLTALSSMINLELPHINVLSKIDMIKQYGKLPCKLSTYITEMDYSELLDDLYSTRQQFSDKYWELNKELVDVLDAYSSVSFFPLDIQHKQLVTNLVCMIDNANGFFYSSQLFVDDQEEEITDPREKAFSASLLLTPQLIFELEETLQSNDDLISNDS